MCVCVFKSVYSPKDITPQGWKVEEAGHFLLVQHPRLAIGPCTMLPAQCVCVCPRSVLEVSPRLVLDTPVA